MAQFYYIALDASGKKKKGVIDTDNIKQARKKIKEMGLFPVELSESQDSFSEKIISSISSSDEKKKSFSFSLFKPRINNASLCLITRQISTLVSSSITIEETLRAVAKQCETPSHGEILLAVREHVCEGLPLSDSMKKFPSVFDDLYTSMVAAGEKSGQLDRVLERLADYTEQKQEIKGKVIQAMVYPVILTIVAISVIGLLLSSVVPKVVEQFIHMKATLPKSTQILIFISDMVKEYGVFLVILLALLCFIFSIAYKKESVKTKVHAYILKMPVIGKVSRSLNTARYAQTLSILHASAVPLLEAMRVSGDTLSNVVAKNKLAEATEKVREGKSLSRSLMETELFTPMMLHMISSGEKSGELENMLARASANQTNDFKRNISIAISVFEPLLIVLMAGVVLFIVVSILQPLMQMNSMVGK